MIKLDDYIEEFKSKVDKLEDAYKVKLKEAEHVLLEQERLRDILKAEREQMTKDLLARELEYSERFLEVSNLKEQVSKELANTTRIRQESKLELAISKENRINSEYLANEALKELEKQKRITLDLTRKSHELDKSISEYKDKKDKLDRLIREEESIVRMNNIKSADISKKCQELNDREKDIDSKVDELKRLERRLNVKSE